jgi:hypothetical protein
MAIALVPRDRVFFDLFVEAGEDIYGLATRLDDIVDHIEESADFMGLYRFATRSRRCSPTGSTRWS